MKSKGPDLERGSYSYLAAEAIDVSASDYTPSDPRFTDFRGIYVGVTGTVVIQCLDGRNVTLTNLAAGVFHPIAGRAVRTTGTTATGIVVGF